MDERLAYSITEAAKIIGISRTLLYNVLDAGNGPPTLKLGRRRLVRRAALDAWLREKQIGGDS